MEQAETQRHEIELRAYQLWEERGRPMGNPEADWTRAEEESKTRVLSKVAREVGSVVGTAVSLLKHKG
jgi:hypothetical protein